jgi:hypothetical protein
MESISALIAILLAFAINIVIPGYLLLRIFLPVNSKKDFTIVLAMAILIGSIFAVFVGSLETLFC